MGAEDGGFLFETREFGDVEFCAICVVPWAGVGYDGRRGVRTDVRFDGRRTSGHD